MEESMGQAITIGLDIAKSVFQVHGVDESGAVVVQRQVRRAQLLPFFRQAAGVPDRHRSLRHGAPLATRADQARSPGPAHAAELRKALR